MVARRGTLLALPLCLFALAAPAHAATVAFDVGGDLRFTAAPGETNHVRVVSEDGVVFQVADDVAITPGTGCVAVSASSVTCTASMSVGAIIDAGDGNDFIELGSLQAYCAPAVVNGGTGDDTIQGVKSLDCTADFGGYELHGGSGKDRLTGGRFDDFIAGDGDDDRIEGWRGDDELDGGFGRDTVDYSMTQGAAMIDLATAAPVNGPEDEADILKGFEAAIGSGGPDVILGTTSAEGNTLDGGTGDDLLDGRAGPDTLIGGDGNDVADYQFRTERLNVHLDGLPGSGGATDHAGDTVAADVEDIWGGSGDDVLTGNAGDNLLNGGHGADVLTGGAGTDYADYSERDEGVTIALDGSPLSGSNADGMAGKRDSVGADIENIFGGGGNDHLYGNAAPNALDGGGGADVLHAIAGGADTLDCGAEIDIARADVSDVTADCETIERSEPGIPGVLIPQPRPPVVQPPVALAPLTVKLANAKPPKLARALATGLPASATCSRTCRLSAELKVDTKAARRLGFKKAVTLATGSAAASGKVTLRFTSAAKRALKKASQVKATLSVTATGADGKTAVARRTVTIKR